MSPQLPDEFRMEPQMRPGPNWELLEKIRLELRRQAKPAPKMRKTHPNELTLRAALRSRFSAAEVLTGNGESNLSDTKQQLAALLAICEPAAGGHGPATWVMNELARRDCFEAWFGKCGRNRARFTAKLKRQLPSSAPDDDPLQRMINAWVQGEAPALQLQTIGELAATQRITTWLFGYLSCLPSPEDVRAARKQSELLAPFRVLTRNFRGRKDELRQLREYVEWLPPQGVITQLLRGGRTFFGRFIDLDEKPPLLIYGLGGAGKTSLVAQFILEHLETKTSRHIPFIYIDFDQAAASLREPLTILMEGARQLALQFPEQAEQLTAFRERCQHDLAYNSAGMKRRISARIRPGVTLRGSHTDEQSHAILEFASIWKGMAPETPPLLLVLDSFEEAQTLHAALLPGLFSLLKHWSHYIPLLRVVLAGRAEIVDFRTERLEVGGLDLEAAIGFLQSHGLANEELARYVANRFGSNPLTLQLAAAVVVREGAQAHHILENVRVRNWIGARVDAFRVQQELVRRNLTHLHGEEVEKLAMPGLVVRRVTPEIILEVLAEPCGLGKLSSEGALALFQKLTKEVSIVLQADSDGSVRYRTELRRQLLPLVKREDPKRTRQIHDAAVTFYGRKAVSASKPEEIAALRAEEIYHRLSRGEEPRSLDLQLLSGVEDHLIGALTELPEAAHAFLATHFGWSVPPEVKLKADLSDWENAEAEDLRSAFSSGSISALRASARRLEARSNRSGASALYPLEAVLYERLGWFSMAMERAEIAYVIVENSKAFYQAWALKMTMGRLAQRMGDWPLARRHLREARKIATRRHEIFLMGSARLEFLRMSVRSRTSGGGNRIFHRAVKLHAGIEAWPQALEEDILFSLAISESEAIESPYFEEASDNWLKTVLAGPAFESLVSEVLAHTGDDESLGQLTLNTFQQRYRQIGLVPGTMEVKAFDIVLRAETTRRISDLRKLLASNTAPRNGTNRATFAGVEIQEVHNAILEAYNHDELDWMLNFVFNKRLEDIIPPGRQFSSEVFTVLMQFSKEGLEREFLAALYRDRQENSAIRSIYAKAGFGLQVSMQQGGQLVPNAPVQASVTDFVNYLPHDWSRYLEIGVWNQKLGFVSAQVCQILIDAYPAGTGFLVGFDLVLTTYHVVKWAVENPEVRLICRFDGNASADSSVSPSTMVAVQAKDWLVAHDRERLGYALLRLNHNFAGTPLPPGTSWPETRRRGFITLPETAPEVHRDDPLLILQHPSNGPLKLAMDNRAVEGWSSDETRLEYRVTTDEGSAGSPCFDLEWNLIALHLGRQPEIAFGTSITAIRKSLVEQGITEFLPPNSSL